MGISLRQLQVFVAIHETGSTAAAAGRVFLSQSATSASLNELENLLRIDLFDRVGKRLVLNDNGRTLLPQARQMLDAAATMKRLFSGEDDAHAAGLHLGASTTIGNYVLPLILAKAAGQSARGHPVVMIANTLDIADAVVNFQLDMGLVEGPCHQADLHVEPWLLDELLIVASPAHPLADGAARGKLSASALREATWLLREPGSGTREAVEHAILPHLHALRPAGEFGNAEAIKHAAAAGMGVACLSRLVVQDLLTTGDLIALQTNLPRLERHFYLIHHKRKVLSARLQGFLQTCRTWQA